MTLAITFSDVLNLISDAIGSVWAAFGNVTNVVTSNLIIAVPVYLGFALSLIFLAITIMKKLGIRGINGGGRRRRGRR